MRNYSVELDESPFARFCLSFILPRTKRKKSEGTTVQGFYQEGGDWVYIDLFTNHSKPTSIGPNHSHCLANYSNSVIIGYLGAIKTFMMDELYPECAHEDDRDIK